MVNYEEAIKKPFTDLIKLVIGIVLSIIPIISWIAKGFMIESSGLGKTKVSKKMPEWKNWGYLFIKGLASDIIFVIYAIPAILVFIIGVGYAIGSLSSIFLGAIPPGMMGETSPGPMEDLIRENWTELLPTLITLAPILLLGLILLLIAFYLTPIAVLNYVKTKKFSKAFDFGAVLKKALTGKYFVAWITVIVITAIVTVILSFIPIIGPAIAIFIMGVFSYSLYGQVYRET